MLEVQELGQIISGRFRVEQRLGKGGVAAVFRVIELATGKELALKRLESGSNERLSALFELEYATLAGLKHPNIVEAYEYGADERGPYYTMELLSGADLRQRAPLPWQVACRYTIEAAYALGVVHARKILHRDVSPRNLWCTPEDRIKLIDFGALAPFGTTGEVVGTPPFVSPETLHGNAVDQRADIYALGGVLYWMVTGVHAFPARNLRELPTVWATPPVAASRRVAFLAREDLPPLPPELDALIESMLSPEPILRPRDTGDLIDRIAQITGTAPEQRTAVVSAPQAAFVGRGAQLEEIKRKVERALTGRGAALAIRARRGEGRSRLLNEATIAARLAGATVTLVDAAGSSGEYGVAGALGQRLLDALPETARAAAQGLERELSAVSSAISERLFPEGEPAHEVALTRPQILDALTRWFVAVSRERPLVVAVDGLEFSDDSSLWLLNGLGREAKNCPLLVLTASATEPGRVVRAAELALEQAFQAIVLGPLSLAATSELVSSIFGEVPNVRRLAERAQRVSEGVPARIMILANALIRREVIHNSDGTWVLHQGIDQEIDALVSELTESSALERLNDEARALARQLAVRAGFIPLDMCKALALESGAALSKALSELMREGVLTGSDDGYRFQAEGLREALLGELVGDERKAAHLRLGRFLSAREAPSIEEELEANVHLLHAGEGLEPALNVQRIAVRLGLLDQPRIGPNAHRLEEALALLDALGLDDHFAAPILSCALVGGYYTDRRLTMRHVERAFVAFDRMFNAPLRERLRPWLGFKLSFFVALIVSGIQFKRRAKRPGALNFRDAVALFFGGLGGLAGMYATCIDADAVLNVARRLEPWTALGKKHVATIMHAFAVDLANMVQDRPGKARLAWQQMLKMLEEAPDDGTLPKVLRDRFYFGAYYALGVLESWRDSPDVLAIADRIENSGVEIYRLSADQLRAIYYANQGDVKRAEQHLARVEQHAIQLANAWQVELWTPPAQLAYALRALDAMVLKRCVSQVERLAKDVPSIKRWIPRARGAHLVVRKRYDQALGWLEQCLSEEPRGAIGWGRTMGTLARAYNGLGQHARAKEIAEHALTQIDPEDLDFPAMHLGLQIEHALAVLGTGEQARAQEMIEALQEKHQHGGVLTRGQLLEARIQVALTRDDLAFARECFVRFSELYNGTGAPALIARVDAVARMLKRAAPQEGADAQSELDLLTSEIDLSQIDSAFTQLPASELAQKALGMLAKYMPVRQGFLWLMNGDVVELSASLDDSVVPSPLDTWARQRIPVCAEADVTQTLIETETMVADPNLFQHENTCYRLHPLFSQDGDVESTIGAVVFPVGADHVQRLDDQVTRKIAASLARVRAGAA